MATERVVIQFRADGTRVVTANIKGIGKAAKGASKDTDTLKNALKALIALETARRIIGLADAFTLLQNRVRVLTDDQAGLVRTTQSLFEVANRTRGSIESTALLFQRLTLATKGLVSGEEDVLEIVETLNKALKISGATTQEAAAGSIQLAQGFAFGALRGDELRSVMEQLPVISRILEKELGVTRGELRALGKEGKITSEIMVSAFQNAREEIEAQFGKVIPTIADQFVILRNNIILMIGDLEKATGIFGLLGSSIAVVAENLVVLSKALLVLTIPAIIGSAGAIKVLLQKGSALRVFFKKFVPLLKGFAAALFSVTGFVVTAGAAIIIFRKEIGELLAPLQAGTAELQIFEREAALSNVRFLKLAKAAEEAAKAAAAFADKLEDETDALKGQSKFLFLSVAAQDQFLLNEKVLADLKKKGIDLDIKGKEEQKKAFLAQAKLIQLEREESDLLRKLEGPLVKINRERATANRLLDIGLGPRQKLLDIVNQRFVQNDKLIRQLKIETMLLKENSVVGAIANDVIEAAQALQAKGIDLTKSEGQQALERAKAAIEENRAAAIRRENLRDFNIDLSERFEREADLANILKENANNEFVRSQILKELTIEQAKVLLQLNAIKDVEFDQVVDKTLQPLRDQLTLLKKESETINLLNVERDISIQRLATEIALKRKGVDVNDDFVKSLLDELDAQKKLTDEQNRRKGIQQEFGIDQTENIQRADDLRDALNNGNLSFDQRVAIMRELNAATAQSTDFTAGLKQAFLDIDTTVLQFGMDIGVFLVNAIDSAAGALAEFAVEGFQDTKKLQQALSDLFKQLAIDIVKATIKLLIFQAVQKTLLGGGAAGAPAPAGPGGGGAVDLNAFLFSGQQGSLLQAGGFLRTGQPSIVGERGPEPFIPTESGRVLPNAALAPPVAPQVTIVNVTDPKEVQAFLSTTEGEDVIMNVIQKRSRQVRGLLK